MSVLVYHAHRTGQHEAGVAEVLQGAHDGGATSNTKGIVTYTGIGKAQHKYTAEFICDWLEGRQGLDLAGVAEVLRVQGTPWLRGIVSRSTPPQRHTFVVAGYQADGTAAVFVVSNFQGLNGLIRFEGVSGVGSHLPREVIGRCSWSGSGTRGRSRAGAPAAR